MSTSYRIVGAELSPFSVKVRSYFRFKSIPHRWLEASSENREKYESYFKIPVIPLVITPDDQGLQDSTPIIESLEENHTEHRIHPSDSTLRFISCLLEEFGDEWGNKWVFHFRWAREVDQLSAATRIAYTRQPQADDSTLTKMTEVIRQRMTGRVWFVGSNVQTAPQIESGFKDAVRLLDSHLEHRPYVLGARPSFADFGLAAQIYSCWIDPTPGGFISGGFPNVLAWIQRMLWPRIEGDFESWSTLEATLMPFLRGQVGGRFMPWTLANLAALSNGSDQFEVELIDGLWKQKPQKYHAKSLQMLRDKYTHVSHKVELDRILEQAGCLEGLQAYD